MSVRNYLKNRTIVKDIGLLIRNTDKVLKLFNLKSLFSRDNNAEDQFSFDILKKIFTFDKSMIQKDKAIKEIDTHGASVFYVNGILTDQEDAVKQKHKLEELLNEKVGLFYNETGGLIIDLLESSYGRNLDKKSEAAKALAVSIQDQLNRHNNDITLVGHSQGAIILNNALELIQENESINKNDLKRINFVTFGAAINECNLNDNIKIEHFANIDDPIPNLGILRKNKIHSGDIFKRDETGHFFVRDYLHPLEIGEFGHDSLFYKRTRQVKKDMLLSMEKKKTNNHNNFNI